MIKELTLEERCKLFELHYPEAECDAQYTEWYRWRPEEVLDVFNIPNRIILL